MASYDRATALIVVDVQNDFADPKGSLSVRGGDAVVPFVNEQVRRALDAGSFVIYTQDWHPAHTPHFAADGGIWPVHCVHDSWGAALHPNLCVEGPVIRKGSHGEDGYSGFAMRDPVSGSTIPTELEGLLRAADVGSVVICGLATDYCVKATALDAVALGFATHVLADGVRAVDLAPGDGDRALEAIRAAGAQVEGGEAAEAGMTAVADAGAEADAAAETGPAAEAGTTAVADAAADGLEDGAL
jgi:nicotinamidase/pyrazinamidase